MDLRSGAGLLRRASAAELGPRPLGTLLVVVMMAGIVSGPTRTLLPVYVDSTLHQPPIFTSTILSLQLAAQAAFALFGGAIADSLGQKRTLLFGLTTLLLSASAFLLRDLWLVAAVVVVAGIASSAQSTSSQSYLVATSASAYLGALAAVYFLGSTLGGAVGNLIAGPLADRLGFGMLGMAMLLWALLLLVGTAQLLPPVDTSTLAGARGSVLETLASYPRLMRRLDVLLVGSVRFLPTCYWGTATLLMPLLIYRLSSSVATASAYATVSLVAAAVCQLAVGRLLDRRGVTTPALFLTALIPVAAALAGLAARSLPLLFAAGVFGTCVAWSISITFPTLARRVARTDEQGRVFGLLQLLWSLGMLIGTVIGGELVTVQPGLPFLVVAALNLPCAASAFVLRRRLANRRRDEPAETVLVGSS